MNTILKSILVVQIFAIPIAICINLILAARSKNKFVKHNLIKVGPINDQEVYFIAMVSDQDIKEIISKMEKLNE